MTKKACITLKKLIDFVLALIALIVLSPIMLIAAIGIKCSSEGPIIYKATRMGKDEKPFVVYKFRTMNINADDASTITAANDIRVFSFGDLLRKSKIDELPQLVNILNGTMSVVGPRPESVDIVHRYYDKRQMKTLKVLPGLASPGSIFNYTHGDLFLDGTNVESDYGEKYLPLKLEMDLYYLENWSLCYDARIICRTIKIVFEKMCGKTKFEYPIEYKRLNSVTIGQVDFIHNSTKKNRKTSQTLNG